MNRPLIALMSVLFLAVGAHAQDPAGASPQEQVITNSKSQGAKWSLASWSRAISALDLRRPYA
ncbi:hypothetical protein [Variovorax sp. J31P207]|uniref:hypothetical protein n=1 Tax=Variovorax sp. J31P207 TaxID=3053510 RepID=UPI0025762B44|nr:hypothetical protein [Variovorax sp. J31P207]